MKAFLKSAIAAKWEIVGAMFVNREGELAQANDRLLKAIRGGAAFFHSTIQCGVFLFESSDLEKTVTAVLTAYNNLAKNGLFSNPCMLPIMMPFPNAGVVFALSYICNGPASDESRSRAAKIGAFASRLPFRRPPC